MRPSILPISIVLLAVFFSCTIEKRVHRPGYHIEWKKRLKPTASSEEQRTFFVRAPEEAKARKSPQEYSDSSAVPEKDSLAQEMKPKPVVAASAQKTSSVNEQEVHEPSLSKPKERQATPSAVKANDAERIFFWVLFFLVGYPLIFLIFLIVGLCLINAAPVAAAVFLSLAGLMLLFPLGLLLGFAISDLVDNIRTRREKKKTGEQPVPPEEPKTTDAFSAVPFLHTRRRFYKERGDVLVGVLLILMALIGIGLLAAGIVYGIQLIAAGTLFWGILLLVVAGGIILFSIAMLLYGLVYPGREETDFAPAFGTLVHRLARERHYRKRQHRFLSQHAGERRMDVRNGAQ